MEAVSYRLRVVVTVPKLQVTEKTETAGDAGKPIGSRQVSDGRGNMVEAAIWRRDELAVGDRLSGPVIIEQLDSTTVVPAGWWVRSDTAGNLELTRGAAA